VVRPHVRPTTRRKLFDISTLREVPFILSTAGFFLGFMGLYILFFHYSPFKNGAGGTLAFYMVSILNAGSIFGLLVSIALADRIDPFKRSFRVSSPVPCSYFFMDCHGAQLWQPDRILNPVWFLLRFVRFVAPEHAQERGVRAVGTRLGTSFSTARIGLLIGSPGGGSLLDPSTGRFIHAQAFCGAVTMTSLVLLLLVSACVVHSDSVIIIKVQRSSRGRSLTVIFDASSGFVHPRFPLQPSHRAQF
jgi:hypothetical protein